MNDVWSNKMDFAHVDWKLRREFLQCMRIEQQLIKQKFASLDYI